MSNHLHVVMRLDPGAPQSWSAEEVAAKWLTVSGKRFRPDGTAVAPEPEEIAAAARDWSLVQTWRRRLGDLGWFMRALKEPIARLANREDRVTGHFWEGRFRSTALLDEAAVIACMAYVDLNPIRAKMAKRPETSDHTSIRDRIHARQYHAARQKGSGEQSPSQARQLFTRLDPQQEPSHAEDGLWLWRFERMRNDLRASMTAETYIKLVDISGRLVRQDKRGAIDPELIAVLMRLAFDVSAWLSVMGKGRQMRGTGLGHVTARAVEARRRGTGWVATSLALFKTEAA